MANLCILKARIKAPSVGKYVRYGFTVWCLTLTGHCSFDDHFWSATPDVIKQAQYALDIKQKALPLYEQAFDIEYPLPKLDTLVANDFDAGAMENWVNVRLFVS
jgi:aminopeptidase N